MHLPAVPKTTVDLNGPAFAALEEMRRTCSVSAAVMLCEVDMCVHLGTSAVPRDAMFLA